LILHFSVKKELDRFARPEWEWTHYPAGELRDDATGAKLKRMGMKPGWPDFILLSPEGVFHGLELKREGQALNDNQEAFHARARVRGWKVAVADTLMGALAILQDWGCLKVKVSEVR
jgi:hypothetical protein